MRNRQVIGNKPNLSERQNNMSLIAITATVLLILLFAILWHDETARKPVVKQHSSRGRLGNAGSAVVAAQAGHQTDLNTTRPFLNEHP
jgi:hypothetical protein